MWFLFCFVIVLSRSAFELARKTTQIHSRLSPSWLLICLLEAPDGIYAVFWLGLVTGASVINLEGSHTLSKKEIETDQ